ncbi:MULTISPECIES: phosphotransferase family protein [Thermocrispum]|jgi:aminoglycoside phosphotransferase (APT) family kinase protein|uniref:Phosphotransferase family protein n=1 Tax=Thermocrispum agreste TaxID=37925 RepID=A0ABD6F9C3_9PSEU|nr:MULTISPECIES: phosphotransferase family protein [Thermocrispum]
MGILDAPPQAIEERFGRQLGRPVRLVERKLAGEGLSDETGVLVLDDDGELRKVVVRLFRPGAMARHEVDPRRLHRLLVALTATPVPVPQPLWFDADRSLFGESYSVVAWVPGIAVVPWSPEGRKYLAEVGRGPIGEDFCRILAEIHAIDQHTADVGFLGVPPAGTAFAEAEIAQLEDYLRRVADEPEPIIVDGLGWLRANVPASERIGLVHGDYRTGNVLFGDDRVNAVIDWEFARLGDPLYDVGWVCCPSNRVDSDLVCMILPQEEFLARYERHAGCRVDRDALHFWITFHQVRHAVMWLDAGKKVRDGQIDDLRLARMHYTMPTMRAMVADCLAYT